MKKIFNAKKILLILFCTAALCGCNSSNNVENTSQSGETKSITIADEPADNSLSYSDFKENIAVLEKAYNETAAAYTDPSVPANETVESALDKAAELLNNYLDMTEDEYKMTQMDGNNLKISQSASELQKVRESIKK